MKHNHIRWLTVTITITLLFPGAGPPIKAQFPVADSSITTSDLVNLGKEIALTKKQYDEPVRVHGRVTDFISTYKDVRTVYRTVENLSRIPGEVLCSQRNNRYLYDFEKIECRGQTYAFLKEHMSIVKETKRSTYSDIDPSNKGRLKFFDGDRLSPVKEPKGGIATPRNKAYQIIGYYNKLSRGRSERVITQRLFDQLNGYK